jgi:hypothetical protein
MTWHTASLVLLGLSIISAAIACGSQVLILRAIHHELGGDRKRDESLRVIYVLFRIHRELFPRSSLRIITGVSYLLVLLSAIGFVVALNLRHT